MSEDKVPPEHWWGKPGSARVWHIFDGPGGGRTLCCGWLLFMDVSDMPVDLEKDTYHKGRDCKRCCRIAGLEVD